MSPLKNTFFLLCLISVSCSAITASQSDPDQLLKELEELIQVDTELGLNVLQPGTKLWVTEECVNRLRVCVTAARCSKASLAAQKMFMHKGKYTYQDHLEYQKFLNQCTDEFMLFDLPPAVSLAESAMDVTEETKTPPLTCLGIVKHENRAAQAAKKESEHLYRFWQQQKIAALAQKAGTEV